MGSPVATPPGKRLIGVLIALATLGLCSSAVLAWAWLRATERPAASVETLSAERRQRLVQHLIMQSPGIYKQAWFEPAVGYVMRKGTVEAWGDRFEPNELGYRAHPVAKAPGTYRVVFVGDSWTYGMGVSEEQTFARRFEELANGAGHVDGRVEAWVLALPGYNAINELAALDFFFDRLQPDAVVLCPTRNDADDTPGVLPNGSHGQRLEPWHEFGDGVCVRYGGARFVDSALMHARWELIWQRVRATERHLQALDVPLLVFFTGTWDEAVCHSMIERAGIEAPYVITPPELTTERWRNPPPVRHPNPQAHELYAQMVLRGLSTRLSWPESPFDERAAVTVYGPPPAGDWAAASQRALSERTAAEVPTRFVPSPETVRRCVIGPPISDDGVMGGATTVLVRRPPGADRLRITLRPLASTPSLYPLVVHARTHARGGSSAVAMTVDGSGGDQTFELTLPTTIADGAAIDVSLRAERVTASAQQLRAQSVRIVRIEPVP